MLVPTALRRGSLEGVLKPYSDKLFGELEVCFDIWLTVLGFFGVVEGESADHEVSDDFRAAGDEDIPVGDTASSTSAFLLRELILTRPTSGG